MRCFWSAPELTSIFQDRIVHCVFDLSMTRMRLRYTSPGCRAFRGKPRGITVTFYWKTIKDLELAWIKPSSQWLGSVNGIWTLYRDSAVLQFLHLLSERGIAGGIKVWINISWWCMGLLGLRPLGPLGLWGSWSLGLWGFLASGFFSVLWPLGL